MLRICSLVHFQDYILVLQNFSMVRKMVIESNPVYFEGEKNLRLEETT